MLWEISLLIIAVSFLLVAVFAIPSLLQIRKSAKSLELTTKTLNQNLPGILTSTDELASNLAQSTRSLHDQIDSVKGIVQKFENVADDVVDFERTLRAEIESPVMEIVTTVSAVVKASRVFCGRIATKKVTIKTFITKLYQFLRNTMLFIVESYIVSCQQWYGFS